MKKLIHLAFISAMLLLSNAAWAYDVTIDLTAQGFENAQDVSVVEQDGITLTFAKNNASYSPKYYNTGTAVRIYGRNSLTVSSAYYITSLTLTFTSSNCPEASNFSVSVGKGTPGVTTQWEGNSQSVKFTNTASSGHWRLQKVKATISLLKVTSIAALRQLSNGTLAELSLSPDNAGIIEYVYNGDGTQAYVRDNSSALSFSNFLPTDAGWHTTTGGALIGSIVGEYNFVGGMPVFTHTEKSIADSILCLDNWQSPSPTIVDDLTQLNGNALRADYVVANGVSITTNGHNTYFMERDGTSIELSDHFGVGDIIPDNTTGLEFNIYGIVGANSDGSTTQLYYTKIEEITPEIALSESSASNATVIGTYDGQTVNVHVSRKMQTDMWNTLCLPFDVGDFSSAISSAKLAEFTSYDAATNTIEFTSCDNLEAGKPYLVMPSEEVDEITILGTAIKSELIPVGYGPWEMRGVFTPTTLYGGDTAVLFLGEGNTLYYPNVTNDLKAFRAYFTTTSESAANISIDGVASSITTATIDGNTTGTRIYNVNGQFVGTSTTKLQKGVYVSNGNKVIIK